MDLSNFATQKLADFVCRAYEMPPWLVETFLEQYDDSSERHAQMVIACYLRFLSMTNRFSLDTNIDKAIDCKNLSDIVPISQELFNEFLAKAAVMLYVSRL